MVGRFGFYLCRRWKHGSNQFLRSWFFSSFYRFSSDMQVVLGTDWDKWVPPKLHRYSIRSYCARRNSPQRRLYFKEVEKNSFLYPAACLLWNPVTLLEKTAAIVIFLKWKDVLWTFYANKYMTNTNAEIFSIFRFWRLPPNWKFNKRNEISPKYT